MCTALFTDMYAPQVSGVALTLARLVERARELGQRGVAFAAAYASGDASILPSGTETFGNVVMEAFASGLPVITVNEGGVADLVQPGVTGMLVPARDPEALADATLGALFDPSGLRRMGRAARAFANERTWPMVTDGLFGEYAEVVGVGLQGGGGEICS